jgi:hypothetical protein
MNTAQEIKTTLLKFNRGVKDVAIMEGFIVVEVKNAKTAKNVQLDFLRTGVMKQVRSYINSDKAIFVEALPK